MKKLMILGMVFVFISLSLGLLTINAHAENKGVVVIPLFETKTVTGGIKVYDKNDQDLGMLIDAHPAFTIFIPELKAAAGLDLVTGHIFSADLFFASDNCTGTAYVSVPFIFRNPDGVGGYRYYKPILKSSFFNYQSVRYGDTGTCGLDDDADWVFAMVEIAAGDIPISLPVALPLRLE